MRFIFIFVFVNVFLFRFCWQQHALRFSEEGVPCLVHTASASSACACGLFCWSCHQSPPAHLYSFTPSHATCLPLPPPSPYTPPPPHLPALLYTHLPGMVTAWFPTFCAFLLILFVTLHRSTLFHTPPVLQCHHYLFPFSCRLRSTTILLFAFTHPMQFGRNVNSPLHTWLIGGYFCVRLYTHYTTLIPPVSAVPFPTTYYYAHTLYHFYLLQFIIPCHRLHTVFLPRRFFYTLPLHCSYVHTFTDFTFGLVLPTPWSFITCGLHLLRLLPLLRFPALPAHTERSTRTPAFCGFWFYLPVASAFLFHYHCGSHTVPAPAVHYACTPLRLPRRFTRAVRTTHTVGFTALPACYLPPLTARAHRTRLKHYLLQPHTAAYLDGTLHIPPFLPALPPARLFAPATWTVSTTLVHLLRFRGSLPVCFACIYARYAVYAHSYLVTTTARTFPLHCCTAATVSARTQCVLDATPHILLIIIPPHWDYCWTAARGQPLCRAARLPDHVFATTLLYLLFYHCLLLLPATAFAGKFGFVHAAFMPAAYAATCCRTRIACRAGLLYSYRCLTTTTATYHYPVTTTTTWLYTHYLLRFHFAD